MNKSLRTAAILFFAVAIGVLGVMFFMQFSAVSAGNIQDMDDPGDINQDLPALGDWVFTVNYSMSNITVINTAHDMVYGPFLEGMIGLPGDTVLDVVVTPDLRTLLISNFGRGEVHFIDIDNPISPTWVMSVSLPFFAEDIAIGYDGHYAFVTDGSFSPMVAAIDLFEPTNIYTLNMGTNYANAVAVAPNGTIVVVDYFNATLSTLFLLEGTKELTVTNSFTYSIGNYLARPVNVGIAPDGETVIVCDAFTSSLAVFRVMDPGSVQFSQVVTGLITSDFITKSTAGVQSIAFNQTGDRAYVPIHGLYDNLGHPIPDRLSVLNIVSPGNVELMAPEVAVLPREPRSDSLFGVDTIVAAKDKIYFGYPSMYPFTITNPIVVVELDGYGAYTLPVGGSYVIPTGIAQAPIDVEMRKFVDRPAAHPGEEVIYQVVLTNHGAGVSQMELLEPLPPGLEFVGPVVIDPPSAGSPGLAPPLLASDLWMRPDDVVTLTFPVRVLAVPDGETILNRVHLESPQIRFSGEAEVPLIVEWFKQYLGVILNQ